MLNRSKIRSMAGSASYEKGVNLYYGSRVYNFSLEEEDAADRISAQVKGSGRNWYDVSILLDREDENCSDFSCECPAFGSWSGICKHCAAVLLEYLDKKQYLEETRKQEKKREADLAFLETLKGGKTLADYQKKPEKKKKKATTPALSTLLKQQAAARALPYLQAKTFGKVRLEPHLSTDPQGGLTLGFKVGVTQMYVIKDLFSFAHDVRTGVEVRYGAKLEFVHHLGAFLEESQNYLKFLLEWTTENRNRYAQPAYSYGFGRYSGYTAAKLRAIPLQGRSLDDFFLSADKKTILAELDGGPEQSFQVDLDLPFLRELTITGEAEGITLQLKRHSGFKGIRYYAYFEDGRVYLDPVERLLPVKDFLDLMGTIPNRTAYIEKGEVPAFCRELLPELEKVYTCEKNFEASQYGVVPVSFAFYLDEPQSNMVSLKAVAIYGEQQYAVYGDLTDAEKRDLAGELEAGNLAASYCNAYDEANHQMILADDEEKLYELLVNGVQRLQELGEVFVSDALKRMKIRTTSKVSVGVSLTGDLLELKLISEDMSMEELVELLSRYDKKKRFYRLKNGDFINTEDDGIAALAELKQGLRLTDSELKKEILSLPRYRALYLDSELKDHPALAAEKNRAFRSLIRNMKTVEDNDFEVPQRLNGVLREYQKRGFLWIKTLHSNGFGGILADDMGLGKTLQVITFLVSEFQENPNTRCLIVSPASLVYNWKNELERFAPELPVETIVGTAAERRRLILQQTVYDQAGRILLTSYDLLKRDMEAYRDQHFDVQVIDEAQFIKNHGTQAAKAVKEIQAGFQLALTGTPVENRLSELWSIFDYLMPGFLYPYARFRSELEQPIVQNQDEEARKRLQKMIRPFVLRRLKKDVLKDLPDKLEENVFARLEGEQQKLYDAHVKRMKLMLNKQSEEEFKTSKIQILSELTRLRQLCCDPGLIFEAYKGGSAKTEMCLDLIKNAVESGHKILLFSQFTTMLEHLMKRLSEEEISFYSLTGSDSKEKRAKLVEAFNQDQTSVFCISLKAGGTGLNLTAADIVIHFDPWWNAAVQNQATDRAHRIGQKNVVTVYRLVAKDTIEESIVRLQDKKSELADQVLGGETMGSGSFSREELLELLK